MLRHALPFVLAASLLTLAGCADREPAEPAETASSPAPPAAPASDEERVFAAARAWAARPPLDGRGVGGSLLRFAVAIVARRPSAESPSTWIVHIPEEAPRTVPMGRDLVVNTATGACGMAPMD